MERIKEPAEGERWKGNHRNRRLNEERREGEREKKKDKSM